MKVVHSWIRDLAALPDDVEAISFTLSDIGLAVESVDKVGATVAGVITARVIKTERHPDAAKVHRVFLDNGDGTEHHVWCGAFNMQPGDIIPWATPGTVMPDGRLIETKPIVGIPSEGMCCSARELGLGDDHGGIFIMDPSTPIGVPYGQALGLAEEIVYDIDVLRNRPDAYGQVGVARDLAARFNVPFTLNNPTLVVSGPSKSASVDIVAGDRCARFTTIIISGIRIAPSPDWMVSRLAASGMRSINNVVDVSNYVMLETNQPNHAYDFATLGGGGFKIRLAADGETMITLDGVERALTTDDLLICDANDRPIGIAGIMGGQNTEISDSTNTIALETAWFEPVGIMQSVARLNLHTEASARNERGMDPFGIDQSIARFVELLCLTCPDLVVHEGMVDARSSSIPTPTVIAVRPTSVSALLGASFTAEQIRSLIEPIGFGCATSGESLAVTVPSWRPDCTLEIDIVEEVARHFGYDKLGKTVPKSTQPGGLSVVQQRRRRVREILLGLGFNEAMPHPFLTDGDLQNSGLPGEAVRLMNPLVVGDDVLRTSLRPGLLKAIAFNESHRRSGVSFFEVGHVYPTSTDVLPAEYESLGVVIAGAEAPQAVSVWRELAGSMGWGARLDQSNVPAGLHPTRSATLSVGKDAVGFVGEIHPDVLDAYGITQRVAVLELNLSRLLEVEPKVSQWKATSRYPSSDIDLAFTVPTSVTAEKIEKSLRQSAGALLVDLALFDVYRSKDAGDSRSLAFRLRLQAHDRTLTDADVAAVRDKCIAGANKLGAQLR
ncbi:MAG: phenylalanine--tRNA ligase subunit beta [Actinomycetota bacterium]|nr:phenylalanine--tRNA ligase subunit beta [Actinomycetota bacterium]MDA3018871.1 phenylalanine--tRNA ligase subunit beta [Actinomycetota bacterium]